MTEVPANRERRSQRLFYLLIAVLFVGYGAIKYRHIALAMDAYQGQVLTTDTTGAAK